MKPNTLACWSLVTFMFLFSCGNDSLIGTTPTTGSVITSTTSETMPSMTPVNVETKEAFTPTTILTSGCDSKAQLPLVDVILTSEDMLKKYPIFEIGNRWAESLDLTHELVDDNSCSLDCAKQLWSPTTVSIVLIRDNTPEQASELVDETRKRFMNILEVTDRPYLSDLARNAWIAYDFSHYEFVLLYSYGSIFVHIINRPAFGFDDFAGEFDLTYALGKTQNEKLCSSGYER